MLVAVPDDWPRSVLLACSLATHPREADQQHEHLGLSEAKEGEELNRIK